MACQRQFFGMLSIKHNARQRSSQHPRDELSKFAISEHRSFTKLFYVQLIENFASRCERLDEHSRLVADRIGNYVQTFKRQGQIFGECAIMRHDAENLAPLAMPRKAAFAKPANRLKSQRAARNVNFSSDALADPAFLHRGGNLGCVLNFADKFMSRRSAKIMIAAQNFNIGVADTRHSQAYQSPAWPSRFHGDV